MGFGDILGTIGGVASSITPLGAVASAIPSLFKLGAGIGQSIKAKKMAKNLVRPTLNEPTYNIPPEVKQYLNMTQNRLVDPRLPGQQVIEDKLGANTANAAFDVGASGGGLNTLSDIYGKQMDATAGLGVDAAKNYQDLISKKQQDVAQALQYSSGQNTIKQEKDLARYKDMFDYNQNKPYQERAAAISALREGGNKNIYGGLDQLSLLGSTLLNSSGLFGRGKKQPPASNPTGAIGADVTGTINPVIGNDAARNQYQWSWNQPSFNTGF